METKNLASDATKMPSLPNTNHDNYELSNYFYETQRQSKRSHDLQAEIGHISERLRVLSLRAENQQ